MLQQEFVALIGFFGRCESRELPHCEKLAAISGGVNPARKRRLAWIPKIFLVIPVLGKVGLRVKPAHWNPGNTREAGAPVLIQVCTGWSADRLLWRLFDRGQQGLLCPKLFGIGRMAIFAYIWNWKFCKRIFRFS